MNVLPACLYEHPTGARGGQKWTLNPLVLELQVSKGVNDDPENQVQDDDDDHEEEEEVVDHPCSKQRLLEMRDGALRRGPHCPLLFRGQSPAPAGQMSTLTGLTLSIKL